MKLYNVVFEINGTKLSELTMAETLGDAKSNIKQKYEALGYKIKGAKANKIQDFS